MKRIIAGALALAGLGVLAVSAAPAQAQQERTTQTCSTCVAPITCLQEDSCVLDYVGGTPGGYWRARQAGGSTWVRLTLVNGN